MSEERPYAIADEGRTVLVMHTDLDESWWMRGQSRSEQLMKDVERVLSSAVGKRLWRRHHPLLSVVEFRIPKNSATAAAVALRMAYRPDALVEGWLKEKWERVNESN